MSKTLEAMLYRIKADQVDHYPALSRLADQFLAKQPGFIRREIHQTHDKPEVFLDLVEWESVEKAQAAADQVMHDEALKPFVEATAEVINFQFYHPYTGVEGMPEAAQASRP